MSKAKSTGKGSSLSPCLCKAAFTSMLLFPTLALTLPQTAFAQAPAAREQQQMQTISGTVLSETDHEPLMGASVVVVGRKAMALTDADGKFTLKARVGETIKVNYIGFAPQQIKATAEPMQISLKEEGNSLGQVVVIGYGVQKKKLVTGATTQIKGTDIAQRNTGNALQAMQGQTPGVNIISSSGQPGSDMKVIIRGQGSNSNNTPLYVIDGVPGGDISTVNPSDIETLDILKDAASAAIYGAQAANGVVIITTKSGKEGRTQITFDAYHGWQSAAKKVKMLNAKQYMELMDEQNVNSGGQPYDWSGIASIHDASGNIYDTNWMDLMFKKNVPVQNYVFGINGGSKNTSYAVSLGYFSQEGIVGGKRSSNYERYNFRGNFEQKFYGDILKFGENVSMAYTRNRGIGEGNMYNNKLRPAFATSPLQPLYLQTDGRDDLNNGYSYSQSGDWYAYDGNPIANLYRGNNLTDRQNWMANVYVELQPVKNLRFKSMLGFNNNASAYRQYSPEYVSTSQDQNTKGPEVLQNQYKGWTLTWTNTVAYNWKARKNDYNAMLGMEAERQEGDNLAAQNTLLSLYNNWSTAYLSNDRNGHTGTNVLGYPAEQYRRASYFGRFGWSYDDRYMLNATLRCDGSSRFAKSHRWGWFPSVSAGWVVTGEKFMESVQDWLDFLKLRISWGQVGNNNIDPFLYAATVSLSGSGYNFGTGKGSTKNSNGAYSNRLGNENLKWETSEQTDFGIDARFFRGRLNFTFDWYNKKTKDWIVQAPVLATAGADAPYINGGNVTNKGVELSLTWRDHINDDFSYNVGANFSVNHNEVNSIPTEGGIIHGYGYGSTNANIMFNNQPEFFRCQNGHAMGFFWGYRTAGIFQNQKQIDDWVAAGNGVLPNTAPGDIIVVDTNHDGTIDDNDKQDLGNGIPKFNFGLNLGFSYKHFDFSALLSGAAGFKIANGGYRNWGNSYKSNYTTTYLGRWHGEGTSNTLPRLTNDDKNWTNFSDIYLQNGNYLRIANITVGYDFAPLISWKGISQARLYFQVQNLYTFTSYDGMDPEVGYGEKAWMSGVDTGCYPHARTFLFGVNLKF